MGDANNYFTVTPMSQRMSMKPGETYTGSILVINPVNSTEDFEYRVYVAPYGVEGQDYKANLTTETTRTQLARWITFEEESGVIEPNGSKEVKFTVKVPENAPGGGQYAAVVVSKNTATGTKEANVAVNDVFELASLIYGQVDGETVHKGEIVENNVPGFVTGAPIVLGALITNEGNIHESATIIIKATNYFTGEVIVGETDSNDEARVDETSGVSAENEGETYTELVMPETTRYIQRDIMNNLPALGVVQVEQTIYYEGAISREVRNVIVCPVWFLAMVGVTAGMIVAAVVRIVMRHKKRKRNKKLDERGE